MAKHVRRAADVNMPLKAGQGIPLPEGLLARLCAMTGMMGSVEGAEQASIQFACGAWLAGYRTARNLAEADLVRQVGITVRQLRWMEWGLADPRLLTDAQRDHLIRELAEDDDVPSLRAVIQMALGQSERPASSVLRWVVEDLEAEIWTEDALRKTHSMSTPGRRPTLAEALFLEVLELGACDSHELLDKVIRRHQLRRAGFGKGAAASVLQKVVEEGWVVEVGEAFLEEDNRDIAIFRLTPRGRYALQLRRADQARDDGTGPVGTILRFLQSLVHKAPPWEMAQQR